MTISVFRTRVRQYLQNGYEVVFTQLNAASLVCRVKSYVRERRFNAFLFLLSFILVLALVWVIWRNNRSSTPSTYISILASPDCEVTRAELQFIYVRNRDDFLRAVFQVKSSKGNLAESYLLLNTSTNLKPINGTQTLAYRDYEVESWRAEADMIKHRYDFLGDESEIVAEEFSGDLFGSNESALYFEFFLRENLLESEFPIDVYIFGFEDVHVQNVFPEPTAQTGNVFKYSYVGFEHGALPGQGIAIRLTATDAVSVASNQFGVFLLGAAFAILTSAMVNILTDFTTFVPVSQDPLAQNPSRVETQPSQHDLERDQATVIDEQRMHNTTAMTKHRSPRSVFFGLGTIVGALSVLFLRKMVILIKKDCKRR